MHDGARKGAWQGVFPRQQFQTTGACIDRQTLGNVALHNAGNYPFYWLEPPEIVSTCLLTHTSSSPVKSATTHLTSSRAHLPNEQGSSIIHSLAPAVHSELPLEMYALLLISSYSISIPQVSDYCVNPRSGYVAKGLTITYRLVDCQCPFSARAALWYYHL